MLMMALGRPHREEAAAGGGGDASITKTDDDVQAGAASGTFTFTSKSIGAADSTRIVLVGTAVERNATSPVIASMTIGGVAATNAAAVSNTSEGAELWYAAVPTGTTATIVITFVNTAFAVGIAVWSILNGTTPKTDSGTDSDSNPATFDLDIGAGGVAAAVVCHRSNTDVTFTSAGLTEDVDRVVDTGDICMSASSLAFASAQTNLTISFTSTLAGVRSPVMATASFPKA